MAKQPEPDPVPGPLGWLEFTVRVVRDRAHTAWAWLADEELLAAVHERGGVAAYLPGERIGTRDQLLLRLAVDAEGRVALAQPNEPPTPGPQLEDFVMSVLEELRVLALVDAETAIGPPGLPHEQMRHDAEQPDPDTRQVYAWKADDAVVGRIVASVLKQPVDLHRSGDWVIGAVDHGSTLVLREPPARGPLGIYPFVLLDRRGELRSFTYVEGQKAADQRIHIEWGPSLQPAPPALAHPDTVALSEWLADPVADKSLQPPTEGRRPAEPTLEQQAVVDRVIQSTDGTDTLRELCSAFGVPALAAELAEVSHGEADPGQPWQTVEPESRAGLIGKTLVDANSGEPQGSLPWQVLDRAIYHRPTLGLVLGFVEMLIAGALVAAILNGALSLWWWIAVAVAVLLGMEHSGSGMLRRRAIAAEREQE